MCSPRKCAAKGCDASVEHRGPRAKYCSNRCLQAQRVLRVSEAIQEARKQEIRSVTCAYSLCGSSFQTNHPQKKYCNTQCQRKANIGKKKSNKVEPTTMVECASDGCNNMFTRNRGKLYCTVKCGQAHRRRMRHAKYRELHFIDREKGRGVPLECALPGCGNKFIPFNSQQKYCCRRCCCKHNNDRNNGRTPSSDAPMYVAWCQCCGSEFITNTATAKNCSKRCRREMDNHTRRRRLLADLVYRKQCKEQAHRDYLRKVARTRTGKLMELRLQLLCIPGVEELIQQQKGEQPCSE